MSEVTANFKHDSGQPRVHLRQSKVVVVVVVVVFCFHACEVLGEKVRLFIPRLRFLFQWRSARALTFHFLGKDQSTVVHRTDSTVAECSLTSCV